jgi:hypothetical protein
LPVTRGEGEHAHALLAEDGGEPAERVGLAAAEGVGRDIRIAECDDGNAAGRERPQDRERRLRRLLQVVDDDEAQLGDPLPRLTGADRRHREAGELGRVELGLARRAHHREVLVDEVACGNPLRLVERAAEFAKSVGTHVVLGGAHHQLAQLGAEAAQPPHVRAEGFGPGRACSLLQVTLDEAREVGILLATGDEARRR